MNRFMKYMSGNYYPVVLLFLIMTFHPLYASGSSEALKGKVENAISSRYDPSDVQVTVNDNGEVVLKGDVNSLYDKYRIYEISSYVQGVKQIDNEIKVDTDLLPEKIIQADIRNLIVNSTAIKEPQKINVDVTGSDVKLSGNVNFDTEKVVAMTLASQADGVTDIQDEITVTPIGKAIDDSNIKNYLHSILINEFPLANPKDISISVNQGFVTIDGAVANLWTKDKMEQEFESVAGVIRIINNLEVNPELINS